MVALCRGIVVNYRAPTDASDADEIYIDLATEVLRSCQLDAVQALKDFLTILRSSRRIERVLGCAARRVAAMDGEAGFWLCHHASLLLPELDLSVWVQQSLLEYYQRLQVEGSLASAELQELRQCVSPGDRLLFRQILDLDV